MTVDQQQVSKLGNVLAPAGAMGENTMDGSVSIDMDLAAAKLQQHAVDISSSRTDPEAMESWYVILCYSVVSYSAFDVVEDMYNIFMFDPHSSL